MRHLMIKTLINLTNIVDKFIYLSLFNETFKYFVGHQPTGKLFIIHINFKQQLPSTVPLFTFLSFLFFPFLILSPEVHILLLSLQGLCIYQVPVAKSTYTNKSVLYYVVQAFPPPKKKTVLNKNMVKSFLLYFSTVNG